MTTRSEHMEWCKARALALADTGDLKGAFSSMASDLSKHPETVAHPAISLGFGLMMTGHLDTPETMREFIEGFG